MPDYPLLPQLPPRASTPESMYGRPRGDASRDRYPRETYPRDGFARDPGMPGDDMAPAPVDVRALWSAIRQHPWIVLVTTFLCASLAAAYVFTTEPKYEASAAIRLADTRREIAGALVESGMAREANNGADPILSAIEILRSRAAATRAVSTPEAGIVRVRTVDFSPALLEDVIIQPTVRRDSVELIFEPYMVEARGRGTRARAAYNDILSLGDISFRVIDRPPAARGRINIVSTDQVLNRLLRSTSAKRRDLTDIVDVRVSAPDPYLARELVNGLVTAFQAVNLDAARQRSRLRRMFLAQQLAQNDTLLNEAQQALTSFRSQKASRAPEEAAQLAATAESYGVRLEELQSQRRHVAALLSRLERAGRPGAPGTFRTAIGGAGEVHSPAVEQLSNSLLNLEATRDSMITGPFARALTNPDVRRNDELMATTLAQLLVAVRNQMADLDEQIDRLSLSADISRRVQAAVPAREARETQLTEAEMTRRKMADQLREEYQRAQIAEAAEAGQVEIVDLAVLPTRAANASKARLILFGAMGGLMLGLVLAYVREQFDTLLRRVSDVETVLDVPALALIPAVGVSSRRFGRSRQGTPPAIASSLGTTLSKRSPPPAIIAGSGSVTSEAFRALRTNLLFSHGGRTLRVLTVTSPLASEGKTTVAVNLAVSFAQQGLRVALIDCDLRRPSVHKVFSLPREPGMTELVQGEVSLEQVVHPTDYAKLFVIMAGRLPSNPAELLGSAEMRQVLETLATTFEVLIIDTPPVLLTSDAAVLSAVADGVLLVVRAGRTERAQGRGAVRQLHTVGARVVGAVLNDPDRKMVDDPGFAYGYGYEYAAAVDTKE